MIGYRRVAQIFTILAILLIAGCDNEKVETLQVGTPLWPGYEPLFLARDQGYFLNSSVSFVEYPIPAGAVRAMVNGSIQAATLTMDEVLKIVELGIPIKVVLVMDISAGGDVILARPQLNHIGELKGRRVAMEGSVLANYMLGRALELNGLERTDIQTITVNATEHEHVFNDEVIDAVVTYEPAKTHLLRNGAKILFSSSDIPGEIVDVLVVHENYLAKHPEVVRELITGWYRALQMLKQHPEVAAKIMSERLRISVEEVLASYNGINFPDKEKVKSMMQGEDVALRNSCAKLVNTMHHQGLLKKELDFSNLFSAEYLR